MAEGRDRAQWSHTSALIAAVAGLFEKVDPDQFNPYAQRDARLARQLAPQAPGAGFAALKTLVLAGGLGSGK